MPLVFKAALISDFVIAKFKFKFKLSNKKAPVKRLLD